MPITCTRTETVPTFQEVLAAEAERCLTPTLLGLALVAHYQQAGARQQPTYLERRHALLAARAKHWWLRRRQRMTAEELHAAVEWERLVAAGHTCIHRDPIGEAYGVTAPCAACRREARS